MYASSYTACGDSIGTDVACLWPMQNPAESAIRVGNGIAPLRNQVALKLSGCTTGQY